ncbi:GntR family transcriptional regulator [Streptomyces sp. NPDC058469]|uniref:GntR family transcriptional regulator n=1 Tax=Streptomyces sp. NPDC058469 TaxID=3346514 RepID=UPI0036658215
MGYRYTTKKERSERIDQALRARIANGIWPPGHRFSWAQLFEEFSLNSWDVGAVLSPVLREMRLDGLIEPRPYIGCRVVIEGDSWSPPAEYADLPHDEYIERVLRERLHDGLNGKGIYGPGEQFPPLVHLAEEFGVSPATVRKATTPLKSQNILVLVGTNRTYVAPDLAKFSAEELLTPSERRKPGSTKLEAFGELHTLAEWSRHRRCRVDLKVLYSRYEKGWDLEKTLVTPKSFSQVHPPKPWASGEITVKGAYTSARRIILSRISDGTYPSGTVIPSADISNRLEISEESVLAALRDLRDVKIVDHRTGIGFFTAITSESPRATGAPRSG